MSDLRASDQKPLKIGLALSGGGSRAIAFHLGCMRALHDRGLLDRVSVVSTVSGGSVIGAIWAYSDCPFDEFDQKIQALLRKGLKGLIVRQTLASVETLQILASLAVSGSLALLSSVARLLVSAVGFFGVGPHRLRAIVKALQAPLPRFASRTTAFICALDKEVFRGAHLKEVKRRKLQVIINATELRTQTAFRYGSAEIGSWRFGKLASDALVAEAVGASAAFPALLPALDQKLRFIKDGTTTEQRVIISDGGYTIISGLAA